MMESQQPVKPGLMRRFLLATSEIFSKKWPRLFFLAVTFQSAICIAFEGYTFSRFQGGLADMDQPNWRNNAAVQAELKTIPTFLCLFLLGFLYELVLVWDALQAKNTIQVIGLCISNLALLVYTAIQIEQIREAIGNLSGAGAFTDGEVWRDVRPVLICVPCIFAAVTIAMSVIAWRLYQEFAWDILKYIGADYRMKKRFLYYQVYIALLKFDFFFFIGFTVQFLVVVTGKSDIEIGLTAAAIPVTIGILLFAAYFTRHEIKLGMISIMVLYLGGLSYFVFKLSRIYNQYHAQDYMPVRKSLTAFTVLTILLIILTIINCLICMFNFGKGLKQHLQTSHRQDTDKDTVSYSLNDVKQAPLPSRMTID